MTLPADIKYIADLDTMAFGQCGNVLECIMEPNPEEESAEFLNVYRQVYSTVSHFLELNWHRLWNRPRLSYFHDNRILLVETRNDIHETPFTHLGSIFTHYLHRDNFVRNLIPVATLVSMNYTLECGSGSTIPDMAIRIATSRGHGGHRVVPVIGECAFVQDTDSALRKIKYEIAGHPEIMMVIMVVIEEHQPYRSPERASEAWRMLLQETLTSPSSFDSLQVNAAQSHDQPIVVAGHTWCHLASVRFHVWVRGDEPINVDVDNTELLARGTLFPNQDMDAVDAMIAKGMRMTRECLATVYQKVTPGSDITALGGSSVALSHNWDSLLDSLMFAVEETAYTRYYSWYNSSTLGTSARSHVLQDRNGAAAQAPSNIYSNRTLANNVEADVQS